MMLAAGLVVVAATLVLAGAELRAARLGFPRPSRREPALLAVVFLVGAAAVVVRLLTALHV